MAGLGIRVYTDEMFSDGLAQALTQQAYDVMSCHAAGLANRGTTDEAQLEYAANAGRAILTGNAKDFVRLDHEWKQAGRQHAGIIVVARAVELRLLIRYVARHLDTTTPETQEDMLLWLDMTSPL